MRFSQIYPRGMPEYRALRYYADPRCSSQSNSLSSPLSRASWPGTQKHFLRVLPKRPELSPRCRPVITSAAVCGLLNGFLDSDEFSARNAVKHSVYFFIFNSPVNCTVLPLNEFVVSC
ncbi:hypothetical protein J6590_026757 [Homalodisca vitripennis]|nr:hypothetical protein J6590_026757 [Homalodisca vitripennis]